MSSSVTVAAVDVELAPRDDDREGAQVALVDAAGGPVSETLTASVRRCGTDAFEIVAPRTFVFGRLEVAVVVGLSVRVGNWRGMLDVAPRAIAPGDKYHLLLPGG